MSCTPDTLTSAALGRPSAWFSTVAPDPGMVACTHLWWHADQTPVVDPLADDQSALEASRARVLQLADVVVPGHGPPFRVVR
jgi:glyoxylase-like metal-dependent hydrolase (beta-lactamase superfamily II)